MPELSAQYGNAELAVAAVRLIQRLRAGNLAVHGEEEAPCQSRMRLCIEGE